MISLVLLGLLLGVGLSSETKPSQGCFSYEPAVATLEGKISRQTFAGRPNFESIQSGDEPETYWVIRLSKSVCVNKGAEGTPDDLPEQGVSNVQLVLSEEQYAWYKDLPGRKVVVNGRLFHAISGHHHTSVLMKVTEIMAE
jgi:hypothetical protein